MRKKITLMNMISGSVFQICSTLSGLIIPAIILKYFGSEVNGLVSSISQFLGFISIAEGGITGVVAAHLYAPLVEKNYQKISSIMVSANSFYKSIATITVVYSIIVAIFFPFVTKSGSSFQYIFSLTLIIAFGLYIQYMYACSLKTLLNADKKCYVVNFIRAFITILNIGLAFFSVKVLPSIHLLMGLSTSAFLLQTIILKSYVSKHYSLNLSCEPDKDLTKDRWSGFAVNIAAIIHNNTDIAILTLFTDFKTVSVYGVYCIVSRGLKMITTACLSGVSQTLGQAYARQDIKEINQKMDLYEYIVFVFVFFLFSVGSLLITPFVQIYTKEVTDANYYQPTFGILLLISEAIYLLKVPHMDLAYVANKFREITIPSFIEAGINIIISLCLVKKTGLNGVAIGTAVAMIYRTIFHVSFSEKEIKRPQLVFYKKVFIFLFVTVLGCLLCKSFFPFSQISIASWIIHGFVYAVIIGGLIIITSILFFKEEVVFVIGYLKKTI